MHVADGRLEMAVLMMQQAQVELANSFRACADPSLLARLQALQETLNSSRSKLQEVVKRSLNVSILKSQSADVARLCKLLVTLGSADEAFETLLRKYMLPRLDDLCLPVEKELLSGADKGAKDFYVGRATSILRRAMEVWSEQQHLLEGQFGAPRTLEAACALQRRTDGFGSALFRAFLERRVEPMVKDTKADCGPLLDEMTRLSLRCEIYARFVEDGAREVVSRAQNNSENLTRMQTELKGLLDRSDLRRGSQEAMSSYALLEMRFLQQGVQRARKEPKVKREDRNVEEEEDCGFIDVDGYFFVLDKSCQRSLTGCNVAFACSIISAAASHAEMDLFDWLQEAWNGPASSSQALMCMLLSRVMHSARACRQLQERLVSVSSKYFPNDAVAHEKIASCCSLFASAAKRLDDDAKGKASRHVALVFGGDQVGLVLKSLKAFAFDSKTVKASSEDGDGEESALAKALQAALNAYASVGDEHVQMLIYNAAAEWISQELETIISSKRFSQVGALFLEAEVQGLVRTMSALCDRAVVTKFCDKLRYWCIVLTVDQPSDVMDIWDSKWPISHSDIRSLLSRRVEFSTADVARVKLGTSVPNLKNY